MNYVVLPALGSVDATRNPGDSAEGGAVDGGCSGWRAHVFLRPFPLPTLLA